MKKTFRYLCVALTAALAFSVASCSKEDYPNPYVGEEKEGAYLYADFTTYNLLPPDEQAVTIFIGRSDSTKAATYNLSVDTTNVKVPATVSFAAGEAKKAIKVTFDMTIGATETFTISLDEKQAYTYGSAALILTLKRDYTWKALGEGTFTSGFFEDSWGVVVLKAAEANLYKLLDCYVEGYNFEFELNEDGTALARPIEAFETGYVHSTYGMVNAQLYPGADIEREDNEIAIPLQFFVSAGSFGGFWEVIELPEE